MHPREVLGEALRNLYTGVTRPLLLAAAFALGIGSIIAFDVRTIVDANAQLVQWRDAGASIIVLEAEGAVDGATCEALHRVDGITGSGAGRLPGRSGPAPSTEQQLPLPTLPLAAPAYAEVTPGFAQLIATAAAGSATPYAATPESLANGGLLLSDSLARTVDRGPGSRLATGLGEARVAGAYATPEDGRQNRFAYAALAQVPPHGTFDFCWAEVWPADPFLTNLIRSAISPTATEPEDAKLGQLNPTLGTSLGAHDLYQQRSTRHVPAIATGMAFALGLISVRLRRLEIASALHAGVTHRALYPQLAIETGTWAAAGAVLAAPGIWFAAHLGNPLPATPVLPVASAGLASAVAAAIVGALTGAALTREHHLFRYFKNR